MTALTKREPTLERFGMFDLFDRMFDDWMKVLPLHRPMFRPVVDGRHDPCRRVP